MFFATNVIFVEFEALPLKYGWKFLILIIYNIFENVLKSVSYLLFLSFLKDLDKHFLDNCICACFYGSYFYQKCLQVLKEGLSLSTALESLSPFRNTVLEDL